MVCSNIHCYDVSKKKNNGKMSLTRHGDGKHGCSVSTRGYFYCHRNLFNRQTLIARFQIGTHFYTDGFRIGFISSRSSIVRKSYVFNLTSEKKILTLTGVQLVQNRNKTKKIKLSSSILQSINLLVLFPCITGNACKS